MGFDAMDDVGWQRWVGYGDEGLDPFTAPLPKPTLNPQEVQRQRVGPRSLVALSLDAVARNVGSTTAADLAQLPEKHREALLMRLLSWGGRRHNPLLTLEAWKLLAPACMAAGVRGVDRRLPQRGQVFITRVKNPHSPLSVYLDQLRPLPVPAMPAAQFSTQFLAHLRILTNVKDDRFQTRELLALATMPNLAVLEILDQTTSVDSVDWNNNNALQVNDRLLRGWSNMANAFPALSVLVLHGQLDDAFTLAALEYVTRFPVLAYFSVSLSLSNRPTEKLGWSDARDACHRLGWSGCRTAWRDGSRCYRLETAEAANPALDWQTEAAKTRMPVLAAHWALRMNALLTGAKGGFGDDALKNDEFASADVDYYMAKDDPVAHQPMVSLTLGTDEHSRAGGGWHKPSRSSKVSDCLFARARGAAARVPDLAYQLTGPRSGPGSKPASGSRAAFDAPGGPPRLRKRKRSSMHLLQDLHTRGMPGK